MHEEKTADIQMERQIVTGLIVSTKFAKEIQPILRLELFDGMFTKTVAQWCMDYFRQYKKSPGRHIQDIFNSHRRSGKIDEDKAEVIDDFLTVLSEEYEEASRFNRQYVMDRAEVYLRKKSLLKLSEDIQAAIVTKDSAVVRPNKAKTGPRACEEAETIVSRYKRLVRPTTGGINPFDNPTMIRNSFESGEEELFRMPGELGRFLGSFCRDQLAAVMAPEKRGKTWWLIEFAMRAFRARANVAFFAVGDMSLTQLNLRLYVYLARRHHLKKYCGEQLVPVPDCLLNQMNTCRNKKRSCRVGVIPDPEVDLTPVDFEDAPTAYSPCTICRKADPRQFKGTSWYKKQGPVDPLDWREAYQMSEKLMKRSGKKRFMLDTYPNNSVSVADLEGVLDVWEDHHKFIPDVVIIDYADILAPIDPRKEFRHQQNETWQELRALSQRRHCCVITATQADAKSYEAKSIREQHFTEDKRKYGHVNKGIITLNQDAIEKRRGIMRIGQMFVREDEYDILRKVQVLECRRIGRPYLDSF